MDERKRNLATTDALTLYRAASARGEGYAPDEDDVDEAVEALVGAGAEVMVERSTRDDVTVVSVDGTLIAIGGDAMGRNAWACVIGAEVSA